MRKKLVILLAAAMISGNAWAQGTTPPVLPECSLDAAPGNFEQEACVKPSHTGADWFLWSADNGKSWVRVPVSGATLANGTHCDRGVVLRRTAEVSFRGKDKDGKIVCASDNARYVILRTAPARRPKAKAKPAAIEAKAKPTAPDNTLSVCGDPNAPEAPEECFEWVEDGKRRIHKIRRATADIKLVNGSPKAVRTYVYAVSVDEDGLNAALVANSRSGQAFATGAAIEARNQAYRHANEADTAHLDAEHRSLGAAVRKIGAWSGLGTAAGAVVCGLASLATGGLAAGVCIPALAYGAGGGATIGAVDAATD